MRTLLDFDLSLEPAGQGYRARVIASPSGEARAEFDYRCRDCGATVASKNLVSHYDKTHKDGSYQAALIG